MMLISPEQSQVDREQFLILTKMTIQDTAVGGLRRNIEGMLCPVSCWRDDHHTAHNKLAIPIPILMAKK